MRHLESNKHNQQEGETWSLGEKQNMKTVHGRNSMYV